MTSSKKAEFFKNRNEAYNWLVEVGCQVARGKFYQDFTDKGFPIMNQDKTVSKYQVALYAMQLQGSKQPNPTSLAAAEYVQRKEKANAEIAEMKAETMRRERDELWLHADQAWAAVAGLIGNVKDTLRRHFHDAQIEIVEAAGGEVARAPEVYELTEDVINRAFNEAAGQSINIRFKKE